jgi:hypothetical protein
MKTPLKRPSVAALCALALCALALCAVTPDLNAQALPSRPEWGVQGAVAFNGGNDFGVGGRVRYPFTLTAPAPINAMADLNWFPGTPNVFDLNWNLAYNFVPHSNARPYAGGGVNATLCSRGCTPEFQLGLNAIGGFEFGNVGQLTPYLEGRYTFFSLDAFIVTFGVRF